jgi:predicted nucleotidyltransferase component of viral defense system
MSAGIEHFQHCAAQTGYGIGPLEKVVRLGGLAAEIARHPLLGYVLALKGGTALSLCFGQPRRLSADLCFNYIGHLELEKMAADRPRVENVIVQLAGRMGYDIQQSADAIVGPKIFLFYRSVAGLDERIVVDLNFLFRLPIAGTTRQKMWQPGELVRPIVRVLSLQEILVDILLAFLDRGAARDAWDLAYAPAKAEAVMATSRFRSWFVGLSVVLSHPLTAYSRDHVKKNVTDRTVAEQLGPLSIRLAEVQTKELIDRTWALISPFMTLRADEVEYVASIQRGELNPELLFPGNPEEARRLAAHPALLWKLLNARTHLIRPKTRRR